MDLFEELAQRLISISSVTRDGNEEIVNFLRGLLEETGLKTDLQQVFHSNEELSKRQFNLLGIHGDPLVDRTTQRGLLLTSHLDTVGVRDANQWDKCDESPTQMKESGGRYYGLGAVDSKLSFLCQLMALRSLREQELKEPVYLAGTCGSEFGNFGARYLVESFSFNPAFVVVGRPTDMKFSFGHKREWVWKLNLEYAIKEKGARGFNRKVLLNSYGKPAHAACPEEGVSAILNLFSFLQRMRKAGFDFKSTEIQGGESERSVADHATALLYLNSYQLEDFKRFTESFSKGKKDPGKIEMEVCGTEDVGIRMLPDNLFLAIQEVLTVLKDANKKFQGSKNDSYDIAHSTVCPTMIRQKTGRTELYLNFHGIPEFFEEQRDLLKGKIKEKLGQYPDFNVRIQKIFECPGVKQSLDSYHMILREAGDQVGLSGKTTSVSYSSEAGLYEKFHYPVVTFGPGKFVQNSHSSNESVPKKQLENTIEFYRELILKICG